MTSVETPIDRLSPARMAAVAGVLVAAAAAIALAAWIATHGRIDYAWSGRPHALRRVTPVSLAAWLLLMAAGVLLGSTRRIQTLNRLSAFLQRRAPALALLLAVAVGAAAVHFGAFTAAGADPYAYVTQARLWRQGSVVQSLPAVAGDAPVSPAAFCPLGYRPGPKAGTMVPTVAPGLRSRWRCSIS